MAFEDLEEVLVRFARNTTGGFPDQRAEEFLIRNLGQTTRLEDLADTVVAWRNGVAVTVGQIAEVRLGAAVILAVQKQPGANTLTLTRAVEKALAALQPALPPDVKADRILFKQADFIEWAVGNVAEALRDGAILVAIVLVLFLMNLRTTVISLTAILLSIAVTALVFHVFGLSLNTMTLGGLAVAIGELVDDAVIDVENVFRRLRENARAAVPRPALQVVFADSREVRNSIVYATVIVVLVFVPLFVLSGIEGHLFTPLGITYVVSILASLVVSLTTTPVLCAWLLAGAKSVHG
ncbi:MAG: putative silver efflux pump, partial [Rhodospirillaceae bacterium]